MTTPLVPKEPRPGSTPVSRSTPRSEPRNAGPRRQISSLQIVFGSIIAISLLLAVNFSGRIAAGSRLTGELRVLQSTISALQMRSTALKVELSNVNSDAFVEQWARSREGRMVKPNEFLVVVVPGMTTPTPVPTSNYAPLANSPEADENWILWWRLFIDAPPPRSGN